MSAAHTFASGEFVPDDTSPSPGERRTLPPGASLLAAGVLRPRPASHVHTGGQGKAVTGDVPAKSSAADADTSTALHPLTPKATGGKTQ